jgi:hypothetical protein
MASAACPQFNNETSFIGLPADFALDERAFYAWQLVEYDSRVQPFPQFLLNRQTSEPLWRAASCYASK